MDSYSLTFKTKKTDHFFSEDGGWFFFGPMLSWKTFEKNSTTMSLVKGQLGIFGVFNSPKNERKISAPQNSNFQVCFLGKLTTLKRHFKIIWPLIRFENTILIVQAVCISCVRSKPSSDIDPKSLLQTQMHFGLKVTIDCKSQSQQKV